MNWYHILIKDIKTTLKDKLAWLLIILLPLLVLTISGVALSGLFNAKGPDLKLAYCFSGQSNNIEPLMHSFKTMEAVDLVKVNSKDEGMKLIKKASVTALIVIPKNFNVNNPQNNYVIKFYYDSSNKSTADILKGMTQGVIKTLNDSLVSVELMVDQADKYNKIEEDTIDQIVNKVKTSFHKKVKIGMTSYGVGGEERNRSFYQVIPGFAVMFLLFSILGGATKLIEERQNKTFRRILITPTKKSDIIIAKWLGMTIEGFCQALILFISGNLIFKLSLGNNPFRLIFFLLIVAGATGSIGIFIASIVKSLKQANGLAMLLFMLMSALGGSWWPLEITPKFMQTAGKFTLNFWAITGIKKIILFNQSLSSLVFEMGVLILIGVLFIFLSFQYFRFE